MNFRFFSFFVILKGPSSTSTEAPQSKRARRGSGGAGVKVTGAAATTSG